MSYTVSFLISVLIVGSSLTGMDSLRGRCALKVISDNLATDPLPRDLDSPLGLAYCKQNLPEAFKVFVQKAVLQKRTPNDKEYDKFDYPCKQVQYDAGAILGLTFVGNTTQAVVVGANNYMQWWETETNILLEEVKLDKRYGRLASSRSGKLIAGIYDQGLTIWSTETHQQLVSIPHDAALTCVSFSPDDRYIVGGTKSGKVIVWDSKERQKVEEYSLFTDEASSMVEAVRMTDDSVIAVAKNTSKMWKVSTKEERVIEVPYKQYMRCVSSHIVSDDLVALCFSHKTIKLVDLKNGSTETITLLKEEGVVYDMHSCCFSKDHKLLVLAEGERNSLWKRSGTGEEFNEHTYVHIADFYGGSWFRFLVIRADNLAYLASEMHGGLQLYSIAATVNSIGLEGAKKALAENESP